MEKEKIIAELQAENAELKNENAKLTDENAKLQMLINYYIEQLRLAQHRQYGASSEKTEQTEPLGQFNEADELADETPETVSSYVRKKKRKGKREEFYEGLATERIVYELPEDERVCPECGKPLHACGHDVLRREVEIIPAQVRAVEHVQVVYACRNCDANGIATPMIKTEVPAPVISGSGIASPSLVSYIICNKYVLALPLYRQEQELERIGVHISRQTMANWVIYVATHWLTAIYDLLRAELLRNEILHADETTLQVIKEKGRQSSQQSYMWMYHTGRDAEKQVALFEYQQTREAKHPQTFLAGYAGFLHVDAYAGYNELEKFGVTLVECWAHARRKFDEALKALKKADRVNSQSNIGLNYCNKLFEFERKFDEENLSHEERAKRRELESKPIAEAFFAWAEDLLPKTLPKSKLGIAVTYAVNQKRWLMNFLLDGRLELSNNRAERTIRPFTVGRNNWLFSFCERGAKASAVVYSIIESALANGLVPFLYMNYLLATLPNITSSKLPDCLPWNPIVREICKIPNPNV